MHAFRHLPSPPRSTIASVSLSLGLLLKLFKYLQHSLIITIILTPKKYIKIFSLLFYWILLAFYNKFLNFWRGRSLQSIRLDLMSNNLQRNTCKHHAKILTFSRVIGGLPRGSWLKCRVKLNIFFDNLYFVRHHDRQWQFN